MKKGTMIQNFRQKVLDRKKDISDQEILLSKSCHVYIENLVETITKLYNQKIKLHIEWTEDPRIAYATSRNELFLNVNNNIVLSANDCVEKVVLLKGLSIHECGHLLFTDFHLLKSMFNVFLEKRQLFPAPKNCPVFNEWLTDAAHMNESEIIQWAKIYKRLENSIEDGFIEYKLLDLLPGEGQCLYALRKVQQASFKSVKEMKSNGYSDTIIIYNGLLMLAKFNTILMDKNDASEPAVKALLDNYNLIQQAVHTEKSYDRMKLVNEVFCNLYHYLKTEVEKKSACHNKSSGSSNGSADSNSQDGGSNSNNEQSGSSGSDDNAGSSNSSSGEQANSSSGSNREPSGSSNGSADSNSQDDGSNSSNEQSDSSGSDDNAGSSSSSSGEQADMSKNLDAMLEHSPSEINEEIDTGSGSVLNDHNINQKPISITQYEEEKIDNILSGTKDEETAQVPSPQDKLLIDNIKNHIAETSIMEEAEATLEQNLQREISEFEFSGTNQNFPVSIVRETDISENAYMLYDAAMNEIGFLVKKTTNELKQRLKDYQQGGKLNGLYNGRYLDRSNLSRNDKRLMCKNELPANIPDMAVSILIDGSGSMRTDKKWWYAILTALTIYLVCRELYIPVMVYSHNACSRWTRSSWAKIKALADFESVDGKDKYRICDIDIGYENRDGMALRFCSEKLAKRREESKFLMIISDGLPSAYNTWEEGRDDIRNVLMDYSKKNVKYIAFGLGDNQKEIEDIYVQNLSAKTAAKFIRSDDASNLPKAFVKVIKDLIKV